jgi:Family of unknown function (DUF6445)
MRIEYLAIDGFYSNVDEVRKFALSQEFAQKGNYPGRRTASFLNDDTKILLSSLIKPFSGNITSWGDENSGAFQYTTSYDRSWIHVDDSANWAGVVYLTPDAPVSAGTGLFRSKVNGLRTWRKFEHTDKENENAEHIINSVDYTKWDIVDRIGNIYNRLILYRGDLLHVSLDYFGHDVNDGRLFQTFFFNTEY